MNLKRAVRGICFNLTGLWCIQSSGAWAFMFTVYKQGTYNAFRSKLLDAFYRNRGERFIIVKFREGSVDSYHSFIFRTLSAFFLFFLVPCEY